MPIVSERNQSCKPTGFSRGYLTRGETESVNDYGGKPITDVFGKEFHFRHCVEGVCFYEFRIKSDQTGYDVRFEMNTAQALGLCVVLEDCLPKMAFGV